VSLSSLAALTLAPAALALEPGVFIDPNGPAGREYSFPLDVARSSAAGHASTQPGAAQPLFGVGITSAAATALKPPGAAAKHSRPVSGRGAIAPVPGPRPAAGARVSERAIARLERSGSGAGPTALLGLAVLAPGLGAGLALRRRRR
jgi:hypothetical protein